MYDDGMFCALGYRYLCGGKEFYQDILSTLLDTDVVNLKQPCYSNTFFLQLQAKNWHICNNFFSK